MSDQTQSKLILHLQEYAPQQTRNTLLFLCFLATNDHTSEHYAWLSPPWHSPLLTLSPRHDLADHRAPRAPVHAVITGQKRQTDALWKLRACSRLFLRRLDASPCPRASP